VKPDDQLQLSEVVREIALIAFVMIQEWSLRGRPSQLLRCDMYIWQCAWLLCACLRVRRQMLPMSMNSWWFSDRCQVSLTEAMSEEETSTHPDDQRPTSASPAEPPLANGWVVGWDGSLLHSLTAVYLLFMSIV
jgi:hypothetical protein